MRRFWIATRPFTFTGALVSAALGTAVARLLAVPRVDWPVALAVAVGCVGAQALANVVNDLVDYRTGVDTPQNFGRHNALVAGSVRPREMLALAIGVAAACAVLTLLLNRRAPLLPAIALGAVVCVGYTVPPISLKRRALGDVAVLLGFGAGMFLGAYVAQARAWPTGASGLALGAYALPCALHITAIVYANNHRDRESDRLAGVRTVANRLSAQSSQGVLLALLLVPFAAVPLLASLGTTTPWSLVALLAAPALLSPLRLILRGELDTNLVPKVARLQGAFGGLFVLGLALATTTEASLP